jgi:hypothetical protein
MGQLKLDDIFSVLILNALSKNFGPLQYSINSAASSSNFNSEMLANRILDEDALIRRRVETGQPANPYGPSPTLSGSSAFGAFRTQSRSPRPVCANCKRANHTTDFCISPGGKMASRSIEDAITAQRASQPRSQTPRDSQNNRPPGRAHTQSAHITTSTPTPTPQPPPIVSSGTVFVNSLPYVPDPGWSVPAAAPSASSAHITEIMSEESTTYAFNAFLDSHAFSPPTRPHHQPSSFFAPRPTRHRLRTIHLK